MKYLSDISYKLSYNKIDDNIAKDFYLPSMSNSISYDRMSGYFGSTIFIIAWSALKEFVSNNGKMRIICSPILSNEDIDAIKQGEQAKTNKVLAEKLKIELNNLWQSEELRKPFQVLSALISNGTIEIKVAYGEVSSNVKRLFHDKVGIFSDGKNIVSFRGSINETFKGLSDSGNIESISVFTSWQNNNDSKRVKEDLVLFNKLWSNSADGVSVISLPNEIKQQIKNYCPKSSWTDLLEEVTTQVKSVSQWTADPTGNRLPRKHQLEALENWVANNHTGILEHATGSGKTFTSLCAIRRSIKEGKTILILVPSSDLLNQWNEEIKNTLSDINPLILLCGGNNSSWKKNETLNFMTSQIRDRAKITIATMDTAVKPEFISKVAQGEHLFLVVDEVHRLGSPNRRNFFKVEAGYKLGVSATPRRFGDTEGTQSLLKYFGGIIQPVYSLQDAIKDEVLTPYFYCPKEVHLSEEEQLDWTALTKQIRERYAFIKTAKSKDIESDTKLKFLLLKRARILKKAQGKIKVVYNILKENYTLNQKWIVYCEDKSQLNEVVSMLLQKMPDIDTREYYAEMQGDREETLKAFTMYGGVIVSIKCLDEGIDIPSTTHAIILASSKNPREFIQRRGRVLRRYPGKNYSWLYDAIVVPTELDEENVSTDTLLCGELSRAIQFAEWSETPYAITRLRMIAAHYKLKIEELSKIGTEDEQ